jgi:hypothetical protein
VHLYKVIVHLSYLVPYIPGSIVGGPRRTGRRAVGSQREREREKEREKNLFRLLLLFYPLKQQYQLLSPQLTEREGGLLHDHFDTRPEMIDINRVSLTD